MNITFETTDQERDLIHKIAQRAVDQYGGDLMNAEMDVVATHLNGCPLDLQKFLDFDDASFGHDIHGIGRFLNRDTGKLGGCFDPRCSLPESNTLTIEEFAQLVQDQQRARYLKDYPNTGKEILEKTTKTKIKVGKKYTKVDVGDSGKFMVVNETGEIFGIKAYGVINKHHLHTFGTLATTDQWYWGHYKPSKIS